MFNHNKFKCFCILVMLIMSMSGCRYMTPGNTGWFCKSNRDCKGNRRCITYRYRGSRHKNRLCTGARRLRTSGSNYGWIILIGTWLFIVVLPAGLVGLFIFARIRDALNNRGQKQA